MVSHNERPPPSQPALPLTPLSSQDRSLQALLPALPLHPVLGHILSQGGSFVSVLTAVTLILGYLHLVLDH